MAEHLWETEHYHWSPWTAHEGIDAYIRSRRDQGWIFEGQAPQDGTTIVLVFKRPRISGGSQLAAGDPRGAA